MARGYNALADVLVTSDGTDVNTLFREAQEAVNLRNEQRDRWVDLLTYRTANPVERVLQFGDSTSIVMEEASEYGLPVGVRHDADFLDMGADGRWYDIATKFTHRALADMSSEQVRSVTNAALEAYDKKVYELVMTRLYNPTTGSAIVKGATVPVYGFWNGTEGTPPAYNSNTFDSTHTHYRASGAATVTSGDLDEIVADFVSHGLSQATGSQIVLFVNPVEGEVVNLFRVASGAKEDFVPAAGARFFTADHLLGEQPVASWGGWPVKGAYGEMLVIEDVRIPAGYIVGLVSGGSNVPTNPIMLREHANPAYRGLKIFEGNNSSYPLVDSYFSVFAGTGVRQRGAGLVMKITAGSYSAPTSLAI